MSFARVTCAQPGFPEAHIVSVEADLSKGLHTFSIVGLPGKAVEEARDRVGAALKHSGFTSPKAHNRKVVISLAPAHLRKDGSHFDVAIALSYLKAAGEIRGTLDGKMFVGELGLDGSVRGVSGVLSVALAAKASGMRELYVPQENIREAALVRGLTVFGTATLAELARHLGVQSAEKETGTFALTPAPETPLPDEYPTPPVDFADIRGQETAKRGLLIAASGRHNIVLHGPPGTGKTLLARAFAGILPPLTFEEVLEATALHSLSGALAEDLIVHPPLRAPHHTASHVSLVGGGAHIQPGEVTLAHRGVLFMDEFPEFERRCLDALRQPLEDKVVTVSRAKGTVRFPANFILVAAMNPTPLGGSEDATLVSERDRIKYQRKISGPIMDRVDLWIEVPHVPHELLGTRATNEVTSATLRKQVIHARETQRERFRETMKTNSDMSVRDIEEHIPLEPSVRDILNQASARLTLSPRSYHRILRLARTIADLEDAPSVAEAHVLEALQYRPRNVFG